MNNQFDDRNDNSNSNRNDDGIPQVEIADVKLEPCDKNQTTTKDDSDLALKHQWKVLCQCSKADNCIEDEVITVSALSEVDLKLYWEERQCGEITVKPQQSIDEQTSQNNHHQIHDRQTIGEQVCPRAFSIPGPHNQMDDDSIDDENDASLALAMEVSEDCDELELYLEQIKQQNEALV